MACKHLRLWESNTSDQCIQYIHQFYALKFRKVEPQLEADITPNAQTEVQFMFKLSSCSVLSFLT